MHDSELRNKINKKLQERLISLREKKNVTQAVVAESTGISRTSIVAYEKGTSIPDLEKLYLLAEYYGVSCDYILGRDDGTEFDINYIIKETGLSEKAIKQLKAFNSVGALKLEIFAINKLIEYSELSEFFPRRKFLNLFGRYISSPNIDEEDSAWYKYIAFMKTDLFLPYRDNEEGQEPTRISHEEFMYHLINKEFQYLVEKLKKNEDTKRDIKNHLKKIVLSYFQEQEEKIDFIDYKKIDDDEGLANAIEQFIVSKRKKRKN